MGPLYAGGDAETVQRSAHYEVSAPARALSVAAPLRRDEPAGDGADAVTVTMAMSLLRAHGYVVAPAGQPARRRKGSSVFDEPGHSVALEPVSLSAGDRLQEPRSSCLLRSKQRRGL